MPIPHFDNSGNSTDSFAQFDLEKELAEFQQRKPWPSGQTAKALYKKPDFRTVLIALEPGATMKEHHADGTLSVQVLKGRVRIGAEGKQFELSAGNLLTLNASIKHDVEGVDESAILLTISWPSDEELRAMKHRGYGS